MVPEYDQADLLYFLGLGPYLSISTVERAKKVLAAEYKVLTECKSPLSLFPAVQIEPLEFWYATLRGLGALDQTFLRGMLQECTWRGVVWGGWLALMQPRKEFEELLRQVASNEYRNDWAASCALALLSNRDTDPEFREVGELARLCREQLDGRLIVPMPLRARPSAEELDAIEQERSHVLETYRVHGLDAALVELKRSPLNELRMPYEQWYRKEKGIDSRRDFIARNFPLRHKDGQSV